MVILGSTGSIGVNTLNICKRFDIKVEALVANGNVELLNKQIAEFKPRFVAIGDASKKELVKHNRVFVGEDGILELLELSNSQRVVNALVGFAGLRPTLKALELNKNLALANKESLVIAGEFINTSKIIPIDSEHFGLWYLLGNKKPNKLYITASGGAFRDWDIKDIKDAKLSDALKHPNWAMGQKITIDSASMVNKLFELLEAKWLFNTTNIDALIERNSIVHALVEFVDGSTTAQLSGVDMKLPIAYAVLDKVTEPILEPLNLLGLNAIKFEKIKESKYPMWQIKEHLLNNAHLGVVLNRANEVAIEGFVQDRYGFFEMTSNILKAYKKFEDVKPNSIEDIFKIDKEVEEFCKKEF
jgi:1-deoxy-D-xylulose-5-phosphate reductoisomerase